MEPLAYSTNVHAADSLPDILWALASGAGRIRRELGWPILGLDLRLGSQALADWRRQPDLLDKLRRCIDDHGLRVTSINAFPLGRFQADRVKDAAYRPDWRDPQRLEETLGILAMAEVLCPVDPIVLSTVPGSFKPWTSAPQVHDEVASALGRWCAAACRRERDTGRRAVLALEPEPRCTLECADEVRAFFTGPLVRTGLTAATADLDGDLTTARTALDRHLGLCYDTCHASVVFDEQVRAVEILSGCGAGIVKCQFSAAPAVIDPSRHLDAVRALKAMAEPRFLHQTYARSDTATSGVDDLDNLDDLLAAVPDAQEIRCHFHIPVDTQPVGPAGLSSTRDDSLRGLAACQRIGCQVISVETYTRSVLGDSTTDIIDGTAGELAWLADRLI